MEGSIVRGREGACVVTSPRRTSSGQTRLSPPLRSAPESYGANDPGKCDSPDTGVAYLCRMRLFRVPRGNAVKLDDLKISSKVLLPAIVLAAATIACAGLGVSQQKQADAATEQLVAHRSPAEVQSARFSRRLSMMGHAAHRVVTYDGGSQRPSRPPRNSTRSMARARTAWTRWSRPIPAIADRRGFRQASTRSTPTPRRRRPGLANDDVGAIARLSAWIRPSRACPRTPRPGATAITSRPTPWSPSANKKANQGALADPAAGPGRRRRRHGLCALDRLAQDLAPGGARCRADMTDLAQGELDVDVAGAGRKDEVGLMARAVQVFKDNAVALRGAEAEQQRISAASESRTRPQRGRRARARPRTRPSSWSGSPTAWHACRAAT
jgi:methyl-accepting chemotaxis protein